MSLAPAVQAAGEHGHRGERGEGRDQGRQPGRLVGRVHDLNWGHKFIHVHNHNPIILYEPHLTCVEIQDAEGHSDDLTPVHDGQSGLPLVGGGRGLACLVQPTVPDVN